MRDFLLFWAKKREIRTIWLFGIVLGSGCAGALMLSIAQQLGQ